MFPRSRQTGCGSMAAGELSQGQTGSPHVPLPCMACGHREFDSQHFTPCAPLIYIIHVSGAQKHHAPRKWHSAHVNNNY